MQSRRCKAAHGHRSSLDLLARPFQAELMLPAVGVARKGNRWLGLGHGVRPKRHSPRRTQRKGQTGVLGPVKNIPPQVLGGCP